MFTQILSNVTPTATRVAVLEDSKLVELYIERPKHVDLVGNIYKGRVSNIAPGMQAAFVDVGLEHDVFLPMGDINVHHLHMTDEGSDDILGHVQELSIRDILSPGQEIDIQIVKEPIGTKGARGTTNLTIPGRYLVLMPTTEHVGVSRRIEDEEERERLKDLVEQIRPPGMGLIVRTVAQGKTMEEFRGDINYLQRRWEKVKSRSNNADVYTLLYQDSNLVQKIIRDIFSANIDEFVIDSKEEFEHIIDASSFLSSSLREKINHYQGETPIFEQYGIEGELEKALNRKVWLPSGGYLIIEETEALVSIDINTGRFLGYSNLEETVFKTNCEAVEQIARQIRLRNLAGIIVIDFIDMEDEEHRRIVVEKLKEAFKRDRIKTNILEITELGLVQMTRQRHRPSLSTKMKESCPYCGGTGRVLSREYMGSKLFREIQSACQSESSQVLLVSAHPRVARLLLETHRKTLNDLEERFGKKIYVRGELGFHQEQFKVAGERLTNDPGYDNF